MIGKALAGQSCGRFFFGTLLASPMVDMGGPTAIRPQ
jgi:hypothetical protein